MPKCKTILTLWPKRRKQREVTGDLSGVVEATEGAERDTSERAF